MVVDDDEQVVDALRDAGYAVLQATWAVQSRVARPDPAPRPGGAGPHLTKPDRHRSDQAGRRPAPNPRAARRDPLPDP